MAHTITVHIIVHVYTDKVCIQSDIGVHALARGQAGEQHTCTRISYIIIIIILL